MFRKVSNALGSLSASNPASSAPTRSGTPTDAPFHLQRRAEELEFAKKLQVHGVPASMEDCRTCADPCDEGDEGGAGEVVHASYPRGFEVDWESELMGSAKPSQRTLVVSTAKSDWPHDHTEDKASLSHHLATALDSAPSSAPAPAPSPSLPGLYTTHPSLTAPTGSAPGKTALFSSSVVSQSHAAERETVLVFPDWVAVTDVENSGKGADELVRGLGGEGGIRKDEFERRVWALPYRAVVLLCSHKRRDKRCHIAAPLLEKALVHELEARDVSVDLRGESLSADDLSDAGPSLDSIAPSELGRALDVRRRAIPHVDDPAGGGQVGIFRISHLGGHRYAGVMILCFPSGAQLYYGRVSPHEIPKVVEETLLGGRVLAGLLRAGGSVVRGGEGKACEKKSILAW